MIFGKIKNYLIAILGSLATVLALGLKWSGSRRKQAEARADQADAINEHSKDVARKMKANKAIFRSRSREIAREIEDKKSTDELSDPNDWPEQNDR